MFHWTYYQIWCQCLNDNNVIWCFFFFLASVFLRKLTMRPLN
jgi:hypothetical protein